MTATLDWLDLGRAVQLVEVEQAEAHVARQRGRAARVLAEPLARAHRALPELVECTTCGEGFRPGHVYRMRYGSTCSDCLDPVTFRPRARLRSPPRRGELRVATGSVPAARWGLPTSEIRRLLDGERDE
jgi:hypothetical protein